MPTTTTVFSSHVTQCRHCGERIGWLPSRRGGLYPVNLLPATELGGPMRAITNDFHPCPRQTPPTPRPEETWTPPPVMEPGTNRMVAPGQYPPTPGITAMLAARGTSTPPTFESVVDLRKAVMAALDVYCVAYARLAAETLGGPLDTAMAGYWRQMKDHVNTQIDEVKTAYGTPAPARQVADNELDPPADPSTWTVPSVPATASLDAVVAATNDRQIDDQLSPDYAGGPEPVPGDWTASDDDVPF